MYKCINKLAPDYLADKFVQRSHIHNRNTRSRNQLDILVVVYRLDKGPSFIVELNCGTP